MQRSFTIFIVGTTAVGKTKLSIQLCKAIGGEVINCDSKQLYKYANIMTAKASEQQRKGVPHHMLDVLELSQNCYNRNKYFEEAMRSIERIRQQGKIPVIVGGTNYYLETILYDIGIGRSYTDLELELKEARNQPRESKQIKQKLSNQKQKEEQEGQQKSKEQEETFTKQKLKSLSKQQKYAMLKQVDPKLAQKLHINDEIRVTSFLQRYIETGNPPSSNYKPYTHTLLNNDTVLFWLRNSDKKQLHDLMGKRINEMASGDGLIEILTVFLYADLNDVNKDNLGVMQSIGYKEFEQLYAQVKDVLFVEDSLKKLENKTFPILQQYVKESMPKVSEKLQTLTCKSIRTMNQIPLLQKCKEVLVKNTVDYSKRQITWIKNRLFACEENRKHFFALDIGRDEDDHRPLLERFESNVKNRAIDILDRIRVGNFGAIEEDIRQFRIGKHEDLKDWKKHYCEQCKFEANGSHQWQQHLKSKRHRGSLTKKERKNRIRNQKLAQSQDPSNSKNGTPLVEKGEQQ